MPTHAGGLPDSLYLRLRTLKFAGSYGASIPSALKISMDEAATPRITSACGFAFSARILAVMTPVESRTNLRSMFGLDRKSTRLNSSHSQISYAVFCLKKKKKKKKKKTIEIKYKKY